MNQQKQDEGRRANMLATVGIIAAWFFLLVVLTALGLWIKTYWLGWEFAGAL